MEFIMCSAPLENNSDSAFRKLCFKHGADYTFTEMARLKSLLKKNKSTWKKIEIKDDTPTIIQLMISNEKDVEVFLKNFKPSKGFRGFNINMGCSAPEIINVGLGCAFMKRIEKTNKIIAVFRKYNYPISIKLRLGLNKFEYEKKIYLNLINSTNPDYFILHSRHGKQTYADPANFEVYDEVVATGKKIIANGDIHTKEQVELLKKKGLYGIMIGRACVHNPGIFEFLKSKKTPVFTDLKTEYLQYAKDLETPQKYIDNILKHLGKEFNLKKKNISYKQSLTDNNK